MQSMQLIFLSVKSSAGISIGWSGLQMYIGTVKIAEKFDKFWINLYQT